MAQRALPSMLVFAPSLSEGTFSMNSRVSISPPVLALALVLVVCSASPARATSTAESDTGPAPRITETMAMAGFYSAHPDLMWRLSAMRELERARPDIAIAQFRRAAKYADKPSQAMLAEMYWEGTGVERDRAVAYAWSDLSAERGWLLFLAKREAYWAEMNETDRARALEVGRELYAYYGDDVAKERKERVLDRERKSATGSRTGFIGGMRIKVPGPGGIMREISGDEYYQDELWKPDRYWAFQDRLWRNGAPGQVTVGAAEAIDSDEPAR